MGLWRTLNGTVTLELTAADPADFLSRLKDRAITLENIHFVDPLTVQFEVKRQSIKQIAYEGEKNDCQIKILQKKGIYWTIRDFFHRPVMVTGICFLLFLTIFLPTRIFFFRVEGNQSISDGKILALATQCGIDFGTSRRDIRSEKVKNALLKAIPELEWVGINTAGCVATISVKERQNTQDISENKTVSSIVAVRDGVIQEITVTGGSAAVKQGQAVKTGQVLISGYTDCGISIRAQRAKGEVYAVTNRDFNFLLPEATAYRGEILKESKNYCVIFGKKQINFHQDSGNLDAECVKMYEQEYMTLPGGFILPVSLVTETCVYYEKATPASAREDCSHMAQFAENYLLSQMVAGTIINKNEELSQDDGAICLTGEYACLEMIGRERNEEIIKP